MLQSAQTFANLKPSDRKVQSSMLPNLNRLWKTVLLTVLMSSQLSSQENPGRLSCSAHFQARANWLRTFDGPTATVDFMTIRAETLWYSVARDCGMRTGFRDQGCKYDPKRLSVSDVITQWAVSGRGYDPLPTCMESEFCSACMTVYETTVLMQESKAIDEIED